MEEDVYKLGAKRYYEWNGEYRNPYSIGTPEYNLFERGWMQSLKRDNGRLAERERFKSNAASFSSKQRGAFDSGLKAELYRSRKG